MTDPRPVLIMAGGTGGHVFPALAVADELKSRGVPVVWLGTRAGIESRLVPEAGYPIEWMSISGLRGKSKLTLLFAPLRITTACWQALIVLLKLKPRAVLGMGGFASGPGGIMAWLLQTPLIVHEQNAIAGLTNRILARFADVVLQAFPAVFDAGVTTGNPVRRSICELAAPEIRRQVKDAAVDKVEGQKAPAAGEKLHLLVIGGSLGAVKLNEIIPQSLSKLDMAERPEVIHQTGLNNIETAQLIYREAGVEAKVEAFIDDMPAAYAWADLVICRSGAMTVFELAAAGIASILVPYPHAVDDHQTSNALYLEQSGAAIVRQQDSLSITWLVEVIRDFSANRNKLLDMAIAARKLAVPDSAKIIADACLATGDVV